jgi:hypothetical protein
MACCSFDEIGPSFSSSTRTICCAEEWANPPMIRVFVVVCRSLLCTSPVVVIPAFRKSPSSLLPETSRATSPMGTTSAPRLRRFMAALPPLPAVHSVHVCRNMSTGASRETRAISPYKNWSRTMSPTTRIFLWRNSFSIFSSPVVIRFNRSQANSESAAEDGSNCLQQVIGDYIRLAHPSVPSVLVLPPSITGKHHSGPGPR